MQPARSVLTPPQQTISSRHWLSIALLMLITGCSNLPRTTLPPPQLAPLQLSEQSVTSEDVDFLAPTPDLLAMNEEMEAFVERYTGSVRSQHERLIQLHRAIKGAGVLNMQYDPHAERTAMEAFDDGTVNCLSYAHLMVAMAREAGLNAKYQWVDVRPNWSRLGERVAVRLHVNVVIKTRGNEQYMADIDPLQPRDITGTHVISDEDAAALYHSNIAMAALAEERLDSAWAHAVKALQLSPRMPHLWVNLGAVYRIAGQHEAAERNYFHALQLDPRDRSAMNNLMVLYELQDRDAERDHWQQKIAAYQASNPYFHAWKGDLAGESGEWGAAMEHYQRAVSLDPEDSVLLYSLGMIHFQLEEFDEASRLIALAIEHATLRSEINNYQIQLDAVKRQQLVAL